MNGLCGGGGRLDIPSPEAEDGSEPYETLLIARLRFPLPSPEEPPPPRRVVVWEPNEAKDGSKLIAVDGLPPEKESGLVDSISVAGNERLIESRLNLENIVLRVSKRGKMTVSRYAVRTMRRTSNAWLAGMLAFPLFSLEEVGRTPQKSRAWSSDMSGPRPENSKSRGRKTACMYGRTEVKVKSHISTRWGISRSSGVRRRVWSKELKPVLSSSRRSSTMRLGARR